MVKTQIQIPDGLYKRLKRLADEQEWSFAETLRRGAELLLATRPVAGSQDTAAWCGGSSPFRACCSCCG